MKRLNYTIIALSIIFGLNGCGTTQQYYIYVKQNAQNIDRQEFLIHQSKCLVIANQSVQRPIPAFCLETGVLGGMCAGQNSRRTREYNALKDQIVEGCMLGYGYVRVPQ